ncbi:MAG: hypothetical protein K2N51_03115 [Lachnospiraceae bacterium]|nr:hypothetical protein [Lachnospiraceae bacterium]
MRNKRISSLFIITALIFSLLPAIPINAKVKLNSTNKTLYVGKTTTIKINGAKKSVKWSVSNSHIRITKQTKTYAKIKGMSKGTSYLKAKVSSKTYKCKVVVKNIAEKPKPTQKPQEDLSSITETTKPSQEPQEDLQKYTEKPKLTQEPQEDLSNITETTKPTQKPQEDLSNITETTKPTQKPQEDLSNITETTKPTQEPQENLGNITETTKPTQKPQEDLSNITETPKPTQEPQEDLSKKVEILAEYTLPVSIGWYTRHFMVVKNNSNRTVDISTSSLAYDKNGKIISSADSSFYALGAGCTSMFYEAFETAEKIEYYDISMNVVPSKYYKSVIQDLSFVQNDIDSGAVFQVTNNGADAAKFVEGYALFFLNGELVDYDSAYFTDNNSEIKPQKTISKQLNSYEDFDSIEFYLTGRK